MTDRNACRSECVCENIEAWRVCIPHDVAQRWCLLTMPELCWRWPLVCLTLRTPSGRKRQQAFKGRTKCK